jgi:hypothetical protein
VVLIRSSGLFGLSCMSTPTSNNHIRPESKLTSILHDFIEKAPIHSNQSLPILLRELKESKPCIGPSVTHTLPAQERAQIMMMLNMVAKSATAIRELTRHNSTVQMLARLGH